MTRGILPRPTKPVTRPARSFTVGSSACAAAALTATLLACSDPGTGPEPTAEVHVAGRAERSLTVELQFVINGSTVPPASVSWTAEPATAATPVDGGRLRLEEAGPLVIRGTAQGTTASLTLDVAEPPLIVFAMTADGSRDVYRARLDGRELVRLTDPSYFDVEPTASTEHVVFTRYGAGAGDLYRVPVEGGPETRLTNTPVAEVEPALSPDGTRLAFARDTRGTPKVWVASIDALDEGRAVLGDELADAIESSPSWSPAGDRLVFMSTARGQADLYIAEVATGVAEVLVDDVSPDVEPAWSPDGSRVAFASERNGQTDLYVVETDTPQATRLTNRAESDGEPAWLPDGRLVYVAWTGMESELRWLDPEDPDVSIMIPVPGERPRNPAGIPIRSDNE